MNELKPNGVTGIVVRINDTSTGRISYRVINQVLSDYNMIIK